MVPGVVQDAEVDAAEHALYSQEKALYQCEEQ